MGNEKKQWKKGEWAKENRQEDVITYLSNLPKKEASDKAILQNWRCIDGNKSEKILTALYKDCNINVDDKDEDRDTNLLLSVYSGQLARVKWFIQQGANIHAKNEHGNNALILSAQQGYLDCIKLVVKQA